MSVSHFGGAAALLLALGSPAASAQTPVTVVNVWAAGTARFSSFGTDLRLAGDLLVVGAERQYYEVSPGSATAGNTGSVYVFRQTGAGPTAGYAEEAVLRPAPVARTNGTNLPNLQYGFAVGTCTVPGGDTFVVGGAPNEPIRNPDRPIRDWIQAGAAYVHRRDAATGAWSLDGRLAVPNPRDNAHGGTAVAVACEPGAAPGDPPILEAIVWVDTRLVVWHRETAGAWSMRQTIPFGVGALPVSGVTDVFVASSPGPAAARPALLIGTQVWRRTGPEATPWVQEGLVTPPRGPDDLFSGLDIDRDLIVIGSEFAPLSGPRLGGRAHVYRYTGTGPFGGWAEEAVLTPAVPRERFGFEVAVWAGPAGDGAGARVAVRSVLGLTTFRRDGPGVWREEVLLEQGPGPTYPWTGVLGGVNGRHVAVGNYLDNRRGTEAGIVHLLDLRSVVAAEGVPGAAAAGLAVSGANPVRSRGEVTLTLAAAAPVTVALFDALGRQVAVLHEGALGAGETRLGVDVSGLPSGVYVVRASSGASASVRLSVVR